MIKLPMVKSSSGYGQTLNMSAFTCYKTNFGMSDPPLFFLIGMLVILKSRISQADHYRLISNIIIKNKNCMYIMQNYGSLFYL